MKILMVCLGNICRSPLAEGILQHNADCANLNWQVDSAGTSDCNAGSAPHHFSKKVAQEHGIDISYQRGRQLHKNDILRFDKIYVMDESNYADVKKFFAADWDNNKVDFLLNELYPQQNKSVPDPWYGGVDGFYEVFTMIHAACEKIIERHTNKK